MKRLTTLLLLLLSSNTFAQNDLIDDSYTFIADNLFQVGTSLDNFFVNNDTLETKKNDTRLVLSSQTIISEHDKRMTYGEFRFELSLPKTEKRFQLVLERNRLNNNDDEDNNNLGRRNNEDQETSAALQFILEESKLWNVRTNVGAKFGLPPLLFARTQLRRSFYYGITHLYPTIKILWQDQKGFNITGEFNTDTVFNKTFTFRWIDQWIWDDTSFIINQSHGPSLYQTIDEKRALSYNARAIGNNDPHEAINYYNLNIRYRELIYSYWLFFEVSPMLEFERTLNFKKDAGLMASIEIVIFKQ